ncbi:MAG: proprotein convertase P-domain-containing protein [Planctomycetota bacterium]|jgi:subtilisin-like proprotein convertase family protein
MCGTAGYRAAVAFCVVAAVASVAEAQRSSSRSSSSGRPSPIDYVRRMDANRNGMLEPGEISDRARPYIERYAREARLSMSRPLSIRAMEEAYRRRQGSSQGSSRGSSSSGSQSSREPSTSTPGTLPGFGQPERGRPVLGFGAEAESLAYAEKEDLDQAAERLRQYDKNRDGFIDREEARGGRWSDDPFRYDRNHDNRLSQAELADRYARRRLAESGASVGTPRGSASSSSRPSESSEDRRRREEEEKRRAYYANRAVWVLVGTLMQRYDKSRDGHLDTNEWRSMGVTSSLGDNDGDGRVNRAELYEWLLGQSEGSGAPLPPGLPPWFRTRDLDGDGQIMMFEFADEDEWSDEKIAEFAAFDLNDDGVIVLDECLRMTSKPEGAYANTDFQMIPAKAAIYSAIEVESAEPIADLNVQISITYTHDDHLDAFLIDPDGERIELFTAVGGSDDHFENTTFDDEASTPITRAKPPFKGTFQPEARTKQQRSLKDYRGNSIQGTWTLMISALRGDRAGALHGWSLITKPVDEEAGQRDDEGERPPDSRDDRPPYRRDGDFRPPYRPGGGDGRPGGPYGGEYRRGYGRPGGPPGRPEGDAWPPRSERRSRGRPD